MNHQQQLDAMHREQSFSLVSTFYLAKLLNHLQGLDRSDDDLLQDVLENRKKIEKAL